MCKKLDDMLRWNVLEGYPSGWRGRFAKSLDWRKLVREFESLTLRQKMPKDGRFLLQYYNDSYGIIVVWQKRH